MAIEVEQVNKAKGVGFFNPDWFKEQGIQGFPIKHIEVKSEHIQNLKKSLMDNNYNKDEPIILAQCKTDEFVTGWVLDGRHRLIACNMVLMEKGELPNIRISHELVVNRKRARWRQIYYEAQHLLRKNSESAAAHIVEIEQELLKEDPKTPKQMTFDYLVKEGGFGKDDLIIANAAYNRLKIEEVKEERKRQALMAPPRVREPEVKGDWTDGNIRESTSDVITPTITFKEFTSELETKCVCGKKTNHAVSVKVFENGKVKLEQVN